MPSEPTHTYRISILEDPNPADLRPFPSKTACIKALWDVRELDDQTVYELLSGGETELKLTNREIVKFHHARRAHGACPRMKWAVIGDTSLVPPTEEGCGCK